MSGGLKFPSVFLQQLICEVRKCTNDANNLCQIETGDLPVGYIPVSFFRNNSCIQAGVPQSLITDHVRVSSDEILNLNSAPKTLISPPGIGKIIQVFGVLIRINAGTVVYDTNTVLFVRDATTGNANFADGALFGALLPSPITFIGELEEQLAGTVEITENGAIDLYAPTGNPQSGNGTLDIWITYKVIDL